MKARRVVVTLEMETGERIKELEQILCWQYAVDGTFSSLIEILQVQANVIKPKEKVKK